jgi:hypothetical protein
MRVACSVLGSLCFEEIGGGAEDSFVKTAFERMVAQEFDRQTG